jgi:hypothetical protein
VPYFFCSTKHTHDNERFDETLVRRR